MRRRTRTSHTPASLWTACLVATSESIKADGRLKRPRGRSGVGGRRLDVIGEDGDNERGEEAVTSVLYCTKCWGRSSADPLMMLRQCDRLWWGRGADERQRRFLVSGRIWEIWTAEMRKGAADFEKSLWWNGRACEEFLTGVRIHEGKMKRIVIKSWGGGCLQKSRGHFIMASNHCCADIVSDKGDIFQEKR